MQKRTVNSLILAGVFLLTASISHAKCAGSPMNPIKDVNWQCIFPIKIAGIPFGSVSDLEDVPDLSNLPVCVCPAPPPLFVRVGIPIAFWEPSLMVETVKDPLCFPSIGMGLSGIIGGGKLGGTSSQDAQHTFAQSHYFIFPVWSIIGMLTDSICVEKGDFTVAYLTELDPLWQSPLLSMIIEPESVLFANPFAQLACMADSAASQLGLSLDPLFWCMGSWGSAYAMTGHIGNSNFVEANAGIAARMLYKQSRQLGLMDCAINMCGCLPTPIWLKSHYRIHILKPMKSSSCMPIGRSGLTWSGLKNIPYKGDNFLWMVFKKRSCCAF